MAHGHGSISVCYVSDGTSNATFPPLSLRGASDNVQPNASTVCVLDGVSFTRSNVSGDAETVIVKVYTASNAPIWVGSIFIPDGETATLDKEFVDGLPMWAASTESFHTGVDQARIFAPPNQSYRSTNVASTWHGGSVNVTINGVSWAGSPAGNDALCARYHFEPSNLRRA